MVFACLPVHRLTLKAFILLITSGNAIAQEPIPVAFPLPSENISISEFATYTITKDGLTDLNTLSSYSFIPMRFAGSGNRVQLPDSATFAWISFKVQNNLAVDTIVVLKTSLLDKKVVLYQKEGPLIREIGRTGTAMPFSQLTNHDFSRIEIKLPKSGIRHLFLRYQQFGRSLWLNAPQLQSKTQQIIEKSDTENRWLPANKFEFFMIGFSFAIFIFSLIKYNRQQKDKAYLWYGLFNLSTCIFALADSNDLVLDSLLWNNLRQLHYFLLFNGLAGVAYLRFHVELLQLKVRKPKLTKNINIFSFLSIGSLLLMMIFDQYEIVPFYRDFTRTLIQLGALYFILIIFLHLKKSRKGFLNYIYYGLVCWIIGLCIYIPYIWFELRRYLPPLIRGGFIMGIPTAIEMVLFLKALVYRDQETEREKIQFQQQLIEQLERNKVLQQSFTNGLEQQVRDRTSQLVEQQKIMEKEKEEKLRSEFERRFSESELKALRSQMNPHFIFNVLNTIESFAFENNPGAASDMIQKFSRLTRLVLENSLHHVVPLEDDLEALQLYIKLEQIRYGNQFSAEVQVDQDVLIGNHQIPPLIIQPYVENAILHGLRNLPPGNGLLRVHVSTTKTYLRIAIEDNGVGRARSAAAKSDEVITHNSLGMSVTQDRIAVFNNLVPHAKANVAIHDLETGTRVELMFPLAVY